VFFFHSDALELYHIVFDELYVDIRLGCNIQIAHHALLNVALVIRHQETVDFLNVFLAEVAFESHQSAFVSQFVQETDEVLTVNCGLFIFRLIEQQGVVTLFILEICFENLLHEVLGHFVLVLNREGPQSNLLDFFLTLVVLHGETHHLEGLELEIEFFEFLHINHSLEKLVLFLFYILEPCSRVELSLEKNKLRHFH